MASCGLSVAKLRSMSLTQFKSINKDELFNIIQGDTNLETSDNSIKALQDSISCLNTTIQNLSIKVDELTELKQRVTIIPDLQRSIAELKATTALQSSIIEQQQRFIEKIDAKERERNIVITGVCEADFDGRTSLEDKCAVIFNKLEVVPGHFTAKRLGKEVENRTRPILVVLENTDIKNELLENAKHLKKAEQIYAKIYIKRDVHPSVRREWKRLYDSYDSEKRKPENAGCRIEIDKRKRQITRDGQVIDKWNLNFLA